MLFRGTPGFRTAAALLASLGNAQHLALLPGKHQVVKDVRGEHGAAGRRASGFS